MTTELFWLALTMLMTALMWVPYILNRIAVRGLVAAVTDTGPENGPHSPWAERMIKAHENAVENLVVFAPAVITAHILDLHSTLLAGAAAVYFFARLVHFVVYSAGVPVVRTLSFAVAWVCVMIFILTILGAL